MHTWLVVAQGCGQWPQDQLHPPLQGNALSGLLVQGWASLAGRAEGQAGADDFREAGKGLAALGLSQPPVPAHLTAPVGCDNCG